MTGMLDALVSVRARVTRALGLLGTMVAIAACSVLSGDEDSSSASSGWTPEPTLPVEALQDETLCALFTKENLAALLDYQASHYRLRTSPADEVRGGWYFCQIIPYEGSGAGRITVNYSSFDDIWVPEGESDLTFDGIPAEFPNNAQPVSFASVVGEGWLWIYDSKVYLAWRYPDGYVAVSSVKVGDPPSVEQIEGITAVMETVLGGIPAVAAGPALSEDRPEATPSTTATPTVATTHTPTGNSTP